MASAQEPCLIRIFCEHKNGDRKLLHEGRPEIWGAGGSQDGTIAVATSADKWAPMPICPVTCVHGDRIIVAVKLTSADGIDVSDCACHIPVQIAGEGSKSLNFVDMGWNAATYDLPASTTAAVWHDLGQGYAVPEGKRILVGGGRIFLSIEDDD